MKISGKVDQFGCGMIKEVSAKLPGEFVMVVAVVVYFVVT